MNYEIFIIKEFMKKVIKINENDIENLVKKILKENFFSGGAPNRKYNKTPQSPEEIQKNEERWDNEFNEKKMQHEKWINNVKTVQIHRKDIDGIRWENGNNSIRKLKYFDEYFGKVNKIRDDGFIVFYPFRHQLTREFIGYKTRGGGFFIPNAEETDLVVISFKLQNDDVSLKVGDQLGVTLLPNQLPVKQSSNYNEEDRWF